MTDPVPPRLPSPAHRVRACLCLSSLSLSQLSAPNPLPIPAQSLSLSPMPALSISRSSWHSDKCATRIACPSGMEPSSAMNLPSFRMPSIWCSARWYAGRGKGRTVSWAPFLPLAGVFKVNSRYRSRAENEPPYLRTSFRHFFTVESLLAWFVQSGVWSARDKMLKRAGSHHDVLSA